MLENKLGITSQAELNKQEEILSKKELKNSLSQGNSLNFQ